MAKHPNLVFSGSIGNIIFYKRWNSFYVRSKPVSVKQTSATKISANKFGKALRISKALRTGLQPLFNAPLSKTSILRLNNAVYKYLLEENAGEQDLLYISGFEFNEQSLLSERLRLTVSVNRNSDNNIELVLPSFIPQQKIIAPAYTQNVMLQFSVAVCDMADQLLTDGCYREFLIPFNDNLFPSQSFSFSPNQSSGQMIVIGCALRYEAIRKGAIQQVNDERWMPAGIVFAVVN